MLRIAICDDIAAYGEWLAKIVEKWAIQRHLNIQLKKFVSGEELLADMEATGYFDIVLMDIALNGGMDGVTVATKIKEIHEHFCLIFISQYDNYYKEVFPIHPFQYLEKPTSENKLIENLDQAVRSYRYLHELYVFRFKGMTYSIQLREVLYFVSDKRVISICMENGERYMFYEKLDQLEKQLEQYSCRFLRIHKSYLVNSRQVQQFHSKYVIMRNKDKLPISMDKKNDIMQFHMEYLEKFY